MHPPPAPRALLSWCQPGPAQGGRPLWVSGILGPRPPREETALAPEGLAPASPVLPGASRGSSWAPPGSRGRGASRGSVLCPGSYAHALDGLYRVAREGEEQEPGRGWGRSRAGAGKGAGQGLGQELGRRWAGAGAAPVEARQPAGSPEPGAGGGQRPGAAGDVAVPLLPRGSEEAVLRRDHGLQPGDAGHCGPGGLCGGSLGACLRAPRHHGGRGPRWALGGGHRQGGVAWAAPRGLGLTCPAAPVRAVTPTGAW